MLVLLDTRTKLVCGMKETAMGYLGRTVVDYWGRQSMVTEGQV